MFYTYPSTKGVKYILVSRSLVQSKLSVVPNQTLPRYVLHFHILRLLNTQDTSGNYRGRLQVPRTIQMKVLTQIAQEDDTKHTRHFIARLYMTRVVKKEREETDVLSRVNKLDVDIYGALVRNKREEHRYLDMRRGKASRNSLGLIHTEQLPFFFFKEEHFGGVSYVENRHEAFVRRVT